MERDGQKGGSEAPSKQSLVLQNIRRRRGRIAYHKESSENGFLAERRRETFECFKNTGESCLGFRRPLCNCLCHILRRSRYLKRISAARGLYRKQHHRLATWLLLVSREQPQLLHQ